MSSACPQAAILLEPPPNARHLEFELTPGVAQAAVAETLRRLLRGDTPIDGTATVAGFGISVVELLGLRVPGLRTFPTLSSAGLDIPSTQRAVWIWARGEDRGEFVHRCRAIRKALAPAFVLESVIDSFVFQGGRDLTGYEDGSENPKAGDATAAAIVAPESDAAPSGSSFAALQLWQHDLDAFAALDKKAQDLNVGRERISNEEIEDAPESAHVKRTAQEDFDPEAFVVRRSMPWSERDRAGLVFLAFGATLDSYEKQLRRMIGLDDGIVDALFTFTRPLSGAYYWCPPVLGGRVSIGLD